MKTPDAMTMRGLAKETQDRRNLRLGLILGAVALVLFFGYMLLAWLPGR